MVELVLAVILFLVCAGLLFHAGSQAALRALIEGTPTTPVGKIMGGLTEIKGKVVASMAPLQAPLSNRPCVFLHLRIEEYVSHGKSGSWRTRVDERRGGRFLVDDGSGRAEVDLYKATVELEQGTHRQCGFLNDATPDFKRLLASHGFSAEGLVFNNTFRCTETIIEEGDRLYVLGEPRMDGERPFFNGLQGEVFFVSDKDEQTLVDNLGWSVFTERLSAFGILAVATAVFWYTHGGGR